MPLPDRSLGRWDRFYSIVDLGEHCNVLTHSLLLKIQFKTVLIKDLQAHTLVGPPWFHQGPGCLSCTTPRQPTIYYLVLWALLTWRHLLTPRSSSGKWSGKSQSENLVLSGKANNNGGLGTCFWGSKLSSTRVKPENKSNKNGLGRAVQPTARVHTWPFSFASSSFLNLKKRVADLLK